MLKRINNSKILNPYGIIILHRHKKTKKINNKLILPSQNFLRNKNISKVLFAQKKATENVFDKKKIPYRSFEIKKKLKHTRRTFLFFYFRDYFN